MLDRSVVASVQSYLESIEREGVDSPVGVIFGSQATGGTHEWSDIDLVVVSPRFDSEYGCPEVDMLWRIAGRLDSRIEPIPCGEKEWEEDDSRAIVEIARREGVKVTVHEPV